MRSRVKVLARLLGLWAIFQPLPSLAADVLTQHNNNARTGANTSETLLTTSNVKPESFGKLWTLYADGQVVAQPLYVEKLAIDTKSNPGAPLVQGTFNALVVATMHNTIYVYDADQENRSPTDGRTKPLWATWLGPARPGNKDQLDMWSTNDPEWGVLGTPVIDPQKSTLWVVAWHGDGTIRYQLHALNLHSGAAKLPPVTIGGPPPNAQKPCDYPSGYNPCRQKQRAALLLAGGTIYVAFGGDGSRGNVFAFDAQTLQQRAVWSATVPPKGVNGGIWQSGLGPAADDDGNVYLITGNGTFDADTGGQNYGDTLVKLGLQGGALSVKDFFTPCDQKFLDGLDLDFGSGGAVLIPGTKLAFGGGKEGIIYLVSRDNLGKYAAGAGGTGCKNPNALQAFQASDIHVHGAGTAYGHIHSSPVFWKGSDNKSRIYVWGENDRLKAFLFSGTKFTDVDKPVRSIYQPPDGMPGGMLSLSSNGRKQGTGIIWAAVPLNGDANTFRGVQGVLLALDALDVSKQLWSSEVAGVRDRLGLFAKYVPPTVAGGKVFVATYGDQEALRRYANNERPAQFPVNYQVTVYGPLQGHVHPARPFVNQDSDDISVIKAVATAPFTLDTTTCLAAGAGNVDCTAALTGKAGGAPAFHKLVVQAGYDFAGCKLLTVTTASKRTGISASTGIGWYAADAVAGSQAMTSGVFVPTGSVKQVGAATLKDGTPALLHQFSGVANCTVGQASFDKLFKPYMQFENGPDAIFRNWDRAQNYRITRAVPQFDRSADVLGP